MSWFGHIARQGQQNQPEQAQEQSNDPHNLLVPDPPLQEENEAVNMPQTTNYDAQHADDEAAGAMEKAVNMLRNFPWTEEDLQSGGSCEGSSSTSIPFHASNTFTVYLYAYNRLQC